MRRKARSAVRRLPAPALPSWLARELPFERYSIDAGGRRMHVMETGKGRPVLLVHGNPTWGFLWRKVARELSGERLRVIMPDLIGLGFSEKPRDPRFHTIPNHARHLGALVDALGLDDVVLGVQDWGGPIGVLAFDDRARWKKLGGLVVLNTALSPPRPGFRPAAFHRFARFPLLSDAAFRLLAFPQTVLFTTQGDPRSMLGRTWRAYVHPLRGLANNVAPLALARMVPDSLEHPSVEPLARCARRVSSWKGPAAIVWGTRDPILGRLLHRIQGMLPRASVTATAAGHFLQEEVPREIAAAIRLVALRRAGRRR